VILSRLLPLPSARLAAFILLIPFCFSQSDAPKTNPDQTTVVNVNEVSMNLVVRTKKGKLVPDLKPEDIAVTDGGVPVKISTLRLVTGDSGEHLLTLVFDRLDSSSGHNAREGGSAERVFILRDEGARTPDAVSRFHIGSCATDQRDRSGNR
jgi:ABC-type enterochelin transport system substrate-binding protein